MCLHKCCGCYGPKNGKKEYCAAGCNSQNGGSINKNVYTWFWVRSSLPKLMWSKCMEYKVIENGAALWYKLTGDTLLPLKVSLAMRESHHKGIMGVPFHIYPQSGRVTFINKFLSYILAFLQCKVTEFQASNRSYPAPPPRLRFEVFRRQPFLN